MHGEYSSFHICLTSFEKRHLRGQSYRTCLGKNCYRGCLRLYIQGHNHGIYIKKCQIFVRLWEKMCCQGEAVSCEINGMENIYKFKIKAKSMPRVFC